MQIYYNVKYNLQCNVFKWYGLCMCVIDIYLYTLYITLYNNNINKPHKKNGKPFLIGLITKVTLHKISIYNLFSSGFLSTTLFLHLMTIYASFQIFRYLTIIKTFWLFISFHLCHGLNLHLLTFRRILRMIIQKQHRTIISLTTSVKHK